MNLPAETPRDYLITVTGATGKTGRHVATGALEHDWAVRRATRRPSDPGDVWFDWSDESSWAPAFAGSDAAYIVVPFNDPFAPGKAPRLLEAVSRVQVPRIVLLSSLDVDSADENSPLRLAETALGSLGVAWAAVRPTWFLDNFTTGSMSWMVEVGRLELPAGDGTIPYVDVRDVAAVALAALRPDGPAGLLPVTGPRQLHHREIAAALGQALGRPIEYQPTSSDEFMARLSSQGFSATYARFLADALSSVASGETVIPATDTVLRTTGRDPITLEKFVTDYASG